MDFIAFLIIFFASSVVVWLVSFLVEALRPTPKTPEAMPWDSSLKPSYVTIDGVKLRYLKVGKGPVLVLLHTLRTQLDLFHKVIPELARNFTVYALDYPGHGYSDIPDGSYDADFFVKSVNGFLDELDLTEVILSGVSIGASISLIVAARHNPRVVRIIPINPYDYYQGKGMARASLLGRVSNCSSCREIPHSNSAASCIQHSNDGQTVSIAKFLLSFFQEQEMIDRPVHFCRCTTSSTHASVKPADRM